jgi:uncharacterized protein (DUF2147 family)
MDLLMQFKTIVCCVALLLLTAVAVQAQKVPARDRICGTWESVNKDLIIRISTSGKEFQANIVWFRDTEGKPLDYWTDVHNPDPALRSRKLLGMSLLRNLTYNQKTATWENGLVYESRHGREWNASAYIGQHGLLHVRGYWHFKFIGRTMSFKRIK